MRIAFSAALVLLVASACTVERTVTPSPARLSVRGARLEGRIEYDGRPEHLPRSLVRRADGDVLFAYSTTTLKGRQEFPQLLPVFNPLTLFGYPTRTSKVTVVARLEILRGSRRLPGYDAQATLRRWTTIYSADVRPELEQEALRAVRDSIDAQLGADSQRLEQALGAARR
jgi:hypothetical protein